MRRRSQEEPKKGAPSYMNTYGDMMTLLLTFFILLFSMSSIDASKFRAFIESFSSSSGLLDGGEVLLNDSGMVGASLQVMPEELTDEEKMEKVKEELEQFIQIEDLAYQVGVQQKGDEVILTFEDMLLFEIGKAHIKPAAVPVLGTLGEKLRMYLEKGYNLKIEGHTDNIPIKTVQFPSNWELSAARAIAVAKFFIEEMDFDPTTVSTEGFGEYRPITDNSTEQGRAMNRRVEIKLTKANTHE
ncbi:MAG: flagellar motor protein MotB [Cellulosilyticaceae bacterium]